MLSRTASELFWMARYLERAESYARVLDVTWKLSMIPRHSQQSRDLALPLNLSMTHELPCPLYHEQSAQLFCP